MKAHAFAADSVEGLARHLQEIRAGGFAPTLAIVFASIKHDAAQVGRVFAEAKIEVFGASSAGEMCSGDPAETVREESIVTLVLDLEPSAFRVRLGDLEGRTPHELGAAGGRWARANFDRGPILVMATGLTMDGERLVRGIQSEVGADTPIFGGLAGDDLRFTQTYVFSGRPSVSRGGGTTGRLAP